MIPRSRAYLLAAVTFAMGFVLAILLSQYLPGPSSYYRRMNDSLEKENKLLKELNYTYEVQLAEINRVLKKSEEAEGHVTKPAPAPSDD